MHLSGLVALCTQLPGLFVDLLCALLPETVSDRRPEYIFSDTTVPPKSTLHGTMHDFSQNLIGHCGKEVVCGAGLSGLRNSRMGQEKTVDRLPSLPLASHHASRNAV